MRFHLKNAQLLRSELAFVGGQWVPGGGGGGGGGCGGPTRRRTYPVVDPSSGQTVAHVPDCTPDDARLAIESAHATMFGGRWAAEGSTARERSQLLRRWLGLMEENRVDLAHLVTVENGKPIRESLGEVQYAMSFVEWFAEEAKRAYGDLIPSPMAGRHLLAIKQPVGVVAMITPWNFPLAMIARKLAPALAAGCTAVIKPSPETPLSALAMAYLAEQAGFPAGTIHVLPCSKSGSPAVGEVLSTDERVRKISVTGSTPVGKLIARNAASTLKRLSLELGGNAPFIVFPPTANGGANATKKNADYLDRAVKVCITITATATTIRERWPSSSLLISSLPPCYCRASSMGSCVMPGKRASLRTASLYTTRSTMRSRIG